MSEIIDETSSPEGQATLLADLRHEGFWCEPTEEGGFIIHGFEGNPFSVPVLLSALMPAGAPFARMVLRSDGDDEFKTRLIAGLIDRLYGGSSVESRPAGEAAGGIHFVGAVEHDQTLQQLVRLIRDVASLSVTEGTFLAAVD